MLPRHRMFLRDDYGGALDTDSANLLRTTLVKALFSTQAHSAEFMRVRLVQSCPSSMRQFRLIQQYVDRYNSVRLHSMIGYVTPKGMLACRRVERDRKLEAARQQRQSRRQQAA